MKYIKQCVRISMATSTLCHLAVKLRMRLLPWSEKKRLFWASTAMLTANPKDDSKAGVAQVLVRQSPQKIWSPSPVKCSSTCWTWEKHHKVWHWSMLNKDTKPVWICPSCLPNLSRGHTIVGVGTLSMRWLNWRGSGFLHCSIQRPRDRGTSTSLTSTWEPKDMWSIRPRPPAEKVGRWILLAFSWLDWAKLSQSTRNTTPEELETKLILNLYWSG